MQTLFQISKKAAKENLNECAFPSTTVIWILGTKSDYLNKRTAVKSQITINTFENVMEIIMSLYHLNAIHSVVDEISHSGPIF